MLGVPPEKVTQHVIRVRCRSFRASRIPWQKLEESFHQALPAQQSQCHTQRLVKIAMLESFKTPAAGLLLWRVRMSRWLELAYLWVRIWTIYEATIVIELDVYLLLGVPNPRWVPDTMSTLNPMVKVVATSTNSANSIVINLETDHQHWEMRFCGLVASGLAVLRALWPGS